MPKTGCRTATDLIEPSSLVSWLKLWMLGTDGNVSCSAAARPIISILLYRRLFEGVERGDDQEAEAEEAASDDEAFFGHE